MKTDILAGGHICLACGNYFVMPEDSVPGTIEAEEAKVLRI